MTLTSVKTTTAVTLRSQFVATNLDPTFVTVLPVMKSSFEKVPNASFLFRVVVIFSKFLKLVKEAGQEKDFICIDINECRNRSSSTGLIFTPRLDTETS